MTEWHHSDF